MYKRIYIYIYLKYKHDDYVVHIKTLFKVYILKFFILYLFLTQTTKKRVGSRYRMYRGGKDRRREPTREGC